MPSETTTVQLVVFNFRLNLIICECCVTITIFSCLILETTTNGYVKPILKTTVPDDTNRMLSNPNTPQHSSWQSPDHTRDTSSVQRYVFHILINFRDHLLTNITWFCSSSKYFNLTRTKLSLRFINTLTINSTDKSFC